MSHGGRKGVFHWQCQRMPRLIGGQLFFTSLRENKKLEITGKRTSAKNKSMSKNLAQFCKPLGAYQHQYETVESMLESITR